MTGTDRNGIYTYSADDTAADWLTLLNLGVSSVSGGHYQAAPVIRLQGE